MRRAYLKSPAILAGLGLVHGCLALAAAAAPPPRPAGIPTTEYRQDPRFARPVRLQPGRQDALQVIHSLGQATGLPVLDPSGDAKPLDPRPPELLTLPFRLAAQEVAVCFRGEPTARELMDTLAGALGAGWYRADGAWLLTDRPDLAWFQVLDRADRIQVLGQALAPCRNLTPRQYQLLGSRGVLLPGDLTQLQRRHWQLRVGLESLVYNSIAPEAADLEGVSLKLERGTFSHSGDPVPKGILEEITFYLPTLEGDPWPNTSSPTRMLQVTRLGANTQPLSGARPPAPRAAPIRDPRSERLQQDRRLSVTIPQVGCNVYGAANAVAHATGVGLVLSTNLNRRLITRLDPRRKSRPGFTPVRAWEVLVAIEKHTGGVWQRAGDAYYLETDPLVERASHLRAYYQTPWREAAFAAFRAQLQGKPRVILQKTGTLRPEAMTEKQRALLKRAAAISFGTLYKLTSIYAPEALDLKGVKLRLRPAETEKNLPRRVEILFPGLRAWEEPFGDRVAATLPF